MANNWYPVVDYVLCAECGTCVNFCPHNVYDKEKSPSPIVVRPSDCIDNCHDCGNRCPVGAITYVGDDTGWTPPNGVSHQEDDCGCGCSGGGCCG
ncbi:MAG: ferredoxin family protein [Bacilli bacterium]|nr:ferredoxin family protein [Bacilli bacterium]